MKFSTITLILCLLCCISGYSNEIKRKAIIEETVQGKKLTKWLGKEHYIDFNTYPELKDIKIIGSKAFEMNSHIEVVILPETVEKIENRAFNTCENLVRVDLPQRLLVTVPLIWIGS
jgi:hypothetical protein